MKIQPIIERLIQAQKRFDSEAYAQCFTDNATVYDEHKTYQGRQRIAAWIAYANESYRTVMTPVYYDETSGTLTA